MKKKRLLSVIALVLGIVLVTSGCGGDKETSGKAGSNTVTWWAGQGGSVTSGTSSLSDYPCIKELMKKTGINIKFSKASSSDWSEQFNLMLASGEYTDIFMYPIYTYPGGPQAAIDENIIIPLNDVFEKYCPNITAYLKKHPEVDKMIKTDKGEYYCFPPIYDDEFLQVYRGPYIRKDLLDKLGMDKPETVDEWTEMLKRFKNELGVEVPLSMRSQDLDVFIQSYGTIPKLFVDGKKIKYGVLEPGYKEALETLNTWYKEGLLDNNIASVDMTFINQNMLNGRSAATVGATGGGIGTLMSQQEEGSEFNLEAVKYPVLNKGDKPMYGQRVPEAVLGSFSCASISSQCENIEAAAKLLDYGYSEEGIMLFNFGIEGESYEMKDGYPTYTEKVTNDKEGRTFGTMLEYYSSPGGMWPGIRDKRYMEQYARLPQQKESIEIWSDTDAKKHMLPQVTLTAEEADEIATLETDIKTYVDSMTMKFITGVEPISNFEEFTSKVKSMGSDKYIKVYQDAYDRYLKR